MNKVKTMKYLEIISSLHQRKLTNPSQHSRLISLIQNDDEEALKEIINLLDERILSSFKVQ